LEQGARGTLFTPHATPAAAYKQWIAGSLSPQGALIVDAGAADALKGGKSLLAAGVRTVEGEFDKGDAVLIKDLSGHAVAKGLAAYGAKEARLIHGQKSDAIESLIGYRGPSVLIHRDNLVWIGG
jgi:glutamate 5-kinase